MKKGKKPRLVFTTDVNGTTTPDNTFAELVRDDGLYEKMADLMKLYTTGECSFSKMLPKMAGLASSITRQRLEVYARQMPLFPGVQKTLDLLTSTRKIDAVAALSTTGFAGLIALVNKYRHQSRLKTAASEVLMDLLSTDEKRCIVGKITSEEDKVLIIEHLIEIHNPDPGLVFHAGDTVGDFPAIVHAAEMGGVGIAFCPNEPLKEKINRLNPVVRKNVATIYPNPDIGPNYNQVLKIIAEEVFKKTGVRIGV